MHNVLSSDTFIVVNKTILNDNRTLLINLYQPLIGTVAVGLYNTLWSFLDRFELMSIEFTHNTLLNNMEYLHDIFSQQDYGSCTRVRFLLPQPSLVFLNLVAFELEVLILG